MSPILVRPVREQLEHDRVIRLLQAKYKKKFEAGINPGAEQAVPVGSGSSAVFPDVVLQSPERSHKLLGVIEVETSESVNHLEAMSQWATFGRLKVPFYLYVPAGCIDTTRRLCTDHQITVDEIWTYHAVGDQMRFTMIMRSAQAAPLPKAAPAPKAPPAPRRAAPAPAPAPAPRKPAAARPAAKPASRARPARATSRTAAKPRPQAAKSKKAAAKATRTQKRK